jgi:hypothetical protein
MDPSNFVVSANIIPEIALFQLDLTQNASWSINSLKVYQKKVLAGSISGAKRTIALDARVVQLIACALMLTMLALVGL